MPVLEIFEARNAPEVVVVLGPILEVHRLAVAHHLLPIVHTGVLNLHHYKKVVVHL